MLGGANHLPAVPEEPDMRTVSALATFALTLALGQLQAQGLPAAPPAGPQGLCCPGARGPQGFADRMASQLKLTDAQKASFQAILAKHKDSMADQGKALKAARKAFLEAMQKPETTPESLKALHRGLSDLQFNRMLERRAMRQEIRAILTPDQREQAARLEGRMEGMRLARGGGMGMGHRRWADGDAPDAGTK